RKESTTDEGAGDGRQIAPDTAASVTGTTDCGGAAPTRVQPRRRQPSGRRQQLRDHAVRNGYENERESLLIDAQVQVGEWGQTAVAGIPSRGQRYSKWRRISAQSLFQSTIENRSRNSFFDSGVAMRADLRSHCQGDKCNSQARHTANAERP